MNQLILHEALAEGVERGWIEPEQRARIRLAMENVLETDATSSAHVVYLANYAFSNEFSQQIAETVLSEAAAPDLELVFCLRPFLTAERCGLELAEVVRCEMSWSKQQEVCVYTRRR